MALISDYFRLRVMMVVVADCVGRMLIRGCDSYDRVFVVGTLNYDWGDI